MALVVTGLLSSTCAFVSVACDPIIRRQTSLSGLRHKPKSTRKMKMPSYNKITLISEHNVMQVFEEESYRSKRIEVAVPYWGFGHDVISKHFKTNLHKAICKLQDPGCNPYTIEAFQNATLSDTVRSHSKLHAKVYIFDSSVLVGSSNLSENGAPFLSSFGLIESNVEMNLLVRCDSIVNNLSKWFSELWNKSDKVDSNLIEWAKANWGSNNNITLLNTKEAFQLYGKFVGAGAARQVIAYGRRLPEGGFLLLAGSLYPKTPNKSWYNDKSVSSKHREFREKMISQSSETNISLIGKKYYKLVKDIICESPHQAAVIVQGGAANAHEEWEKVFHNDSYLC